MHIIHAFLHFTSLGVKKVKKTFHCFCDPRNGSESDGTGAYTEHSSLVSSSTTHAPDKLQDKNLQPSLTDLYEDFTQTRGAIFLFLFHATIYFSFAVLGYSVLVESWPILDSLYMAVVVFTTIGYGDIAPDRTSGKLFTIFLALYGIVILGIFLGVLGEYLVESHDRTQKAKRQKLKSNVVQSLATSSTMKPTQSAGNTPQQTATSTTELSKELTLWHDVWNIVVLEAPVVTVLCVLGLLIGYFEGWSGIDCIYWVVITGSTIGFGDFSPKTNAGKIGALFFCPLAVAVLGEFLGRIASSYLERKKQITENEFLSRSLTLCDIKTMDVNQDGTVDKSEFLSYILIALQKVEKEDIDEIMALFDKLDKSKDGYLSQLDLMSDDWKNNFRASLIHVS